MSAGGALVPDERVDAKKWDVRTEQQADRPPLPCGRPGHPWQLSDQIDGAGTSDEQTKERAPHVLEPDGGPKEFRQSTREASIDTREPRHEHIEVLRRSQMPGVGNGITTDDEEWHLVSIQRFE